MGGTSEGKCNIPGDMAPAIPPGGLFGGGGSGWGNPGYQPPSNITSPTIGGGAQIMPAYHDDDRLSCSFNYGNDLSQYKSFDPGAGLEIDPATHQAIGGPPSGPHIMPAYPGGNAPELPANARTLNRNVFCKPFIIRTENEMWMHLLGYIPVFVHLFTTKWSDYNSAMPAGWVWSSEHGGYVEAKSSANGSINYGTGEPNNPKVHKTRASGVEVADGEVRDYNLKGAEGRDYQLEQKRRYNAEARNIAVEFVVEAVLTILTGGSRALIGRWLITKLARSLAKRYGVVNVGIRSRGIIVDLIGKPHKGIPTPHTFDYIFNKKPGSLPGIAESWDKIRRTCRPTSWRELWDAFWKLWRRKK